MKNFDENALISRIQQIRTKFAGQRDVTCKLIKFDEKTVHLIPINERYETKVIGKDDLVWALAVICHITL